MNVHIPPAVGLRISVTLALLSGIDTLLMVVMLVATGVGLLSGLDVTNWILVLQGGGIALGVLLGLLVLCRLLNKGA